MIKRMPITNDLALEIMWRRNNSTNVLLVAAFSDDKGFILDDYCTVRDAEKAARHFTLCYRISITEGFTLIPGFFVHEEIGCSFTVAEGLAVGEPIWEFRETLRELKKARRVIGH